MSDHLDRSLDDIISKNKRSRGPFSNSRGIARASFSRPGPTRRFSNRGPARPSPYSTRPPFHLEGQMWPNQILAIEGSSGETGTKLYVSNLDYGVSNEDIKLLFSEIGDLKRYSINYDRSGRSKGTAEVVFLHQADALAAIKRYNNVQLDGKLMKIELVGVNLVSPAVPPTTRGLLPNPRAVFRGVQGRFGPRGNMHGGSSRGSGRGRGRGRGRDEKLSAADLDADLDKYHLDAMQIN